MLLSLIGRLVQFALALVSVRALTTTLAPDQMALWSLLTTTTTFFALLLINPVGMFLNRRLNLWIAARRDRSHFHLFAAYLVCIAAAASICLIAAAQTPYWPRQLSLFDALLVVTSSLVFNSWLQTLVPSFNLLGRIRSFVTLNSLTLFVSLGLALAATHLWQATAAAWLLGIAIGQAAMGAIAYQIFFRKRDPLPSTMPTHDQLVTVFRFCRPIALSVGLGWLHYQGYRFYLADTHSLQAFGLFAAGYGLAASLLSALEQVLATWFQPSFYRSASSPVTMHTAWQHYATSMLPASLFGGVITAALGPHLVVVLLAPQYHNCVAYFQSGVVAELTRIAVGVCSLHAHSTMRTRSLLKPYVLGATAGLIGVVTLSSGNLGLSGAPIGVALGGLVATAGLIASMRTTTDPQSGRAHFWRLLSQSTAASTLLFAICLIIRREMPIATWGEHLGVIIGVGLPSAWVLYRLVRGSLMTSS